MNNRGIKDYPEKNKPKIKLAAANKSLDETEEKCKNTVIFLFTIITT